MAAEIITLRWADLKWHECLGQSSSDRISDLVREIDADSLVCFFG